jgi:hypothetical protein
LQLKEAHRDALNYESLLREVVSEMHTNWDARFVCHTGDWEWALE